MARAIVLSFLVNRRGFDGIGSNSKWA